MDSLKFQKSLDDNGRITGLEIGGMLVVINAQQLKKELLSVAGNLNDQIQITITDVDDMDLSFIQLIVAFIKQMDEIHVTCQFNWNIDEDQKLLLENVGLINELYLNNSNV